MKNGKFSLTFLLIALLVVFLSGCSHQNEPPTARFSMEPDSGEAPLEVTFDASDSSDPDGEIISYDWEVNGESIEGGKTAEHTFDSAGEWEVKLTVRDDEGEDDSKTELLYVDTDSNQNPEAEISTTPEANGGTVTIEAGNEVDFDGSGSSDPDGSIESYEWDFGDGEGTKKGEVVSHTYEKAGDYTTKLTVTDDAYGRDSATVEVEVEAEDLLASFTWEPETPEVGEEVTFDASGSAGQIETYEWDLGDGEGTGNGRTISYSYDEAGDYQVELTVTDEYGSVDSVTEEISVFPSPPPPP